MSGSANYDVRGSTGPSLALRACAATSASTPRPWLYRLPKHLDEKVAKIWPWAGS